MTPETAELVDLRARHEELRHRFEQHERLDEQRHDELRRDVAVIKERQGETQAAVIALTVGVNDLGGLVRSLQGRVSWRVAVVVGIVQGLVVAAQHFFPPMPL